MPRETHEPNRTEYIYTFAGMADIICLSQITYIKTDENAAYTLVLVLSGAGELSLRYSGACIPLHQHNACLLEPCLLAGAVANGERELKLRLIHFYTAPLQGGMAETSRLLPAPSWLRNGKGLVDGGSLLQPAEQLYVGSKSDAAADRLRCHATLQLMLAHWIDRHEAMQATATAEEAIAQTLNHIRRHLHEELPKSQLAALANFSPSHYSLLFKQTTGMSPAHYIAQLRLNHAKKQLLTTTDDLQRIAESAGYKDIWYFSRKFKLQSGVAPSVFRKRDKLNVVSYSYPCTSHLLALGVKPCAALVHPSDRAQMPEGTVRLEYEKSVDLHLRMIKPLKPDLILCLDEQTDANSHFRGAVETIAPVVAIPWMSLDWQQQLRTIGDLLNRRRQAEEWIEAFARREEEVGDAVRAAIGTAHTVGILLILPGACLIYGARNIGYVLYRSLRLTPPTLMAELLTADPNFYSLPIKPEQLPAYTGDRMIVLVRSDLPGADNYYRQLRRTEHWQEMERICRNRISYLSPVEWLGYEPMSIRNQLEEAALLFIG